MSKKPEIALERRTFCAGSLSLAALGPLALSGCGGGSAASESAAGAPRLLAGDTVVGQPAARVFKHPGLLHTEADFDRMSFSNAAIEN